MRICHFLTLCEIAREQLNTEINLGSDKVVKNNLNLLVFKQTFHQVCRQDYAKMSGRQGKIWSPLMIAVLALEMGRVGVTSTEVQADVLKSFKAKTRFAFLIRPDCCAEIV